MSVLAAAVAGWVLLTALRGPAPPVPRTAAATPPAADRAALSSLAPLPPAGAGRCDVTVSGSASAASAIPGARGGEVICLRAGTYAGLVLAGAHAGDVTVQAVPGEAPIVTAGPSDQHGQRTAVLVAAGASHLVIHGLRISGMVELEPGTSYIRIDHNDISGGPFGVRLDSEDCHIAGAPTWGGCAAEPAIGDVIVSGNRIHDIGGRFGDDAINVNHFAGLRVTGNEMFGILEGGNHSDCFQSTFGGSDLVFDHNYEHDNNCQGFFVKDGVVSDAVLYDNLFVRDEVERAAEANLDIYDVTHLTLMANTSWSGSADLLRSDGAGGISSATVASNVFETFENGCCGETTHVVLHERDNFFGHAPVSFAPGRGDTIALPRFRAAAAGDFRLAAGASAGVDWTVANVHYGP